MIEREQNKTNDFLNQGSGMKENSLLFMKDIESAAMTMKESTRTGKAQDMTRVHRNSVQRGFPQKSAGRPPVLPA